MTIEIKPVISRSELREFIYIPAEIHKNHLTWLPNIYLDEWSFYDPAKNSSFAYCDTVMFLASREGKPAGRIMGIIHRKYNEIKGEKTARFFGLECYDDRDTSHALLSAVESWAREKGMNRMIGPYGFSDKDPQGLMIKGFDILPVITAACNEAYLVKLVEQEGYLKEVDCFMFHYDLGQELPEVYPRVHARITSFHEYTLHEFHTKKELKPFIIPVLGLTNEAFRAIYGFVPMSDPEKEALAKRYLPVIDPRFVKVVTRAGEVVAFMIAIPNLTPGIQKSKGKLFPFGFLHILAAARKTKQLDLMLGAVSPPLQGHGLEVLMAVSLTESAKKAGFKNIEVHLVLETNKQMNAEMKRVNAIPNRQFRVFQKSL